MTHTRSRASCWDDSNCLANDVLHSTVSETTVWQEGDEPTIAYKSLRASTLCESGS